MLSPPLQKLLESYEIFQNQRQLNGEIEKLPPKHIFDLTKKELDTTFERLKGRSEKKDRLAKKRKANPEF